MRPRAPGFCVAGVVASLALHASAQPKLMGWADLMARPLPKATARVAYGPAPEQFAEVWRPEGRGPFPTVLMLHGGCWRSGLANLHIMDYAAEDLRRRGIAVWNVEYRGVDRDGGGYPGTFLDVGAAADALLAHGRDYRLRTDRLVMLGHSAGGHLALWLAARRRLPGASPLRDAARLDVAEVVSLGGLPDLATAQLGCGEKTVARLLAGSTGPDRLSDTSAASLLPLGVRQVLIHGALDDTSPPSQGRAYAAKARAVGDRVRLEVIPGEGHVEEIAPGSAAWSRAADVVAAAIGRR